jgi:LCP family protein required for cell wall assembly
MPFANHIIDNQYSNLGSAALIQVIVSALLTKTTQSVDMAKPTVTLSPTPDPTLSSVPTINPFPISDRYYPDGILNIPQTNDQINKLLLGSNERPSGGYRTDMMILLNLNPISGIASIVSFPRNLCLLLPGDGYERINTSQELGGFELTQKTFEYNFGIHPDYYALGNFAGFKNISNLLDGVVVYSALPLFDRCDLSCNAEKYCGGDPGLNHLDAEKALWYSRSRYSTIDDDRVRRCQELAFGIFQGMMNLNVVRNGPALFHKPASGVVTKLDLATIMKLLPMAEDISQPEIFQQYVFGPSEISRLGTPFRCILVFTKHGRYSRFIDKCIV